MKAQLKKALERRAPLARSADTTCFRWVNAEADGLPHITVDGFGRLAVVSLYADFSPEEEQRLVEAVVEVGETATVYLKRRPKEARVVANTLKSELSPEVPAYGPAVESAEEKESGLRFLIRPAQGLSVGLYLDMRETRAWVKSQAKGRTVLNLFAYTCGFGVAAHAGGALRAVNVDLSRRVLDWGEENLRLNGGSPERTDFLSGDVFEWLGRLAKKEQRFSMVLLDPPGFSTAKGKSFTAATQYARLVEAAAACVEKDGLLVSCCNVAQLAGERFEQQVERGLSQAGRVGRKVRSLGASPVDFPAPQGREGPLKVRVHAL